MLGCQSDVGVCRRCYGYSLATGAPSEIGDAVGIIAAQSIGEPGTQLTMRTFHEGGVAGSDITHGLPRVVELFEARNPKGAAILSEIAGRVERIDGERSTTIVVWPEPTAEDPEPEKREYPIPRRTRLMVSEGEIVGAGDPLTEGSLNPTELLELSGNDPGRTEVYIVHEVLRVYESQGVEINDKHIELIVRQMLKKVRVEDAGDTRFLPGQLVDKPRLVRENRRVAAAGAQQAETVQVILGITKASLATESFLSAASFQETTKVLTDAAIEGKIDRLTGLKENVIIGKLIPASTGLKRYRQLQISPGEGSDSSTSACSRTWRRRSRSTATASRSCSARTETSRSSSPSGSRSSPPTGGGRSHRPCLGGEGSSEGRLRAAFLFFVRAATRTGARSRPDEPLSQPEKRHPPDRLARPEPGRIFLRETRSTWPGNRPRLPA